MIPRKYQPLFPKARGSNNTDIWRWGEGDFVKENMNALLQLRPDEHDSTHGVIEPNQSMALEDYTQALHNTQERWAREEIET
ncbi:MAG: hypothetical protein NT023_06570 [Armatimonadetes bacterium]|nr:hypothetical protein [Armatimonadota bacterium]